ncbi:MAG TPA: SIMPL domain-containing protein [Piscinibacter sp.]|jgi:predicted secreted protein|uniref:SIMPL domain-containing protein n=1 Tax=Piscinibacter sp. TaxID=1903157 RepID=UPI002B8E7AC1|nr:SIMPL domain-containing protein [Piscinibacter sp.]HNK18670.1 SIMPL domain-containing protein [Piscinibacter sp.]
MRSRPIAAMLAATTAALASVAHAEPAPLQGVVSLSASATVEVTKDLLNVVLSTNKEGQDAASVQSQLKQALDAALAEARKAAKPGQIEVQTGNFSLYPRYAPKGGLTGWQGSAELVIEGKDMSGIGALTGRITTMSVARVSQGVSRELREKVESDLAAQAIARYRAKAADYAKQFGYSGYVIREVNVSGTEPPGFVPMPMVRAKAMASVASDEALPVEAGKAQLAVNVSGSVQLTK